KSSGEAVSGCESIYSVMPSSCHRLNSGDHLLRSRKLKPHSRLEVNGSLPDLSERCAWCGSDPLYVAYHDHEWGVPEYDSRALWEKLVLDGFQAGLSWITILRKREAFRETFEGFDPERVAAWGEPQITRALQNPGIIRHRGKIEAAVRGARLFLEIEAGEGFSPFIWSFVGGRPIQNHFTAMSQVPAKT